MSGYWTPLGAVLPTKQASIVYQGTYASATAYNPGDVVLYNGVNYIALAPSTGQTPPLTNLPPTFTYGLSPPVNPKDGDIWFCPISAVTSGAVWQFRYDAASTFATKWEFCGGPPFVNSTKAADTVTTTGAWVASPSSPSVTVQRTGDYQVSSFAGGYNAGGAAGLVYSGIFDNANNEIVDAGAYVGGVFEVGITVGPFGVSLTAGTVLTQRYYQAATANMSWGSRGRGIALLPVRVQ